MLKYNITRLFDLRGIIHPTAFLREKGFTRSESERFPQEKMKGLSLSQIERLCLALKCLPNDLFVWIPKKEEENNEDNPLWKIKVKNIKSIKGIGENIPIEKMDEFIAKVKEIEAGYK